MTPEQVRRRRAVEALRSGVPSWDAVAELGTGQAEAEDSVVALLDRVEAGRAGGVVLGAGFGAGKSHLLLHLAHLAMERGFAVSTVVISKETPLHDPAKVLRAAVEALLGPGRVGGVVAEAAAGLDVEAGSYAELSRWVTSAAGPDSRFAATLLVHERLRNGDIDDADEILDAVVRFWSGDPLRVPELRRWLKAVLPAPSPSTRCRRASWHVSGWLFWLSRHRCGSISVLMAMDCLAGQGIRVGRGRLCDAHRRGPRFGGSYTNPNKGHLCASRLHSTAC